MKTSLQFKLSQQLTLTPQLQQAIKLLQLSALELEQELETILADNPMLERLDDPLHESLRIAANGSIEEGSRAAQASTLSADETPEQPWSEGLRHEAPDEIDSSRGTQEIPDEAGDDWSSHEGPRAPTDDNDEERTQVQVADTGRTLRDHLVGQLAATRCTPLDKAIVEILIENLDDDGFLDATPDEILACLPEQARALVEAADIQTALNLLQSFDPSGVGARDLRESLELQLRALAERDHSGASPAMQMAQQIVHEHLDLLAARDFTRLKRALRCDDNALRDAQSLIRSLNPRPGAAFCINEPTFVIPDVVVRKVRGSWEARLNARTQPQLQVNAMYERMVRSSRGSGGENLSPQLQEARWLIKNLKQRAQTIERVSQAIVERQKSFFSHGPIAMRPLVLREIADELGLHESTVSRVTTSKYMLTPFGTFELKYFFGSHVATETGGQASSTAIRELIRQLIEAEDPKTPLSDSRIAELLGEKGMVVARRTVAKYREASRIPPVAQRKVL